MAASPRPCDAWPVGGALGGERHRSPRPHLAISAAGIGVGADGVASTSTRRLQRSSWHPTSFADGRRQYGAYDIDTLTAAVKTAKAQAKLDVPIVPVRSTTSRLTPRFCLLGALSGHSAGRPTCGNSVGPRSTLGYRLPL